MGTSEDYDSCDALGLAALVHSGAASPQELLAEAQRRLDERNPAIHAVIRPLPEVAARQAQAVNRDAVFAGVPFLLKDLCAHLEGTVLSRGCGALKDFRSTHDSELVKRYIAAGVLIMGKTNTPEFGLMGITEPLAFGATRNPWDLSRTPGGSSGGSAAAVAAGIVPMASASDGGGSIRIPASCCGLFGLKPGRGRTPSGPSEACGWDGASAQHVLTRSVRDSAAMLDASVGPEVGAPWTPPATDSATTYLQHSQTEPRKLRIAYTERSLLGGEVAPVCREAVQDAARLLSELGHELTESHPPVDGEQIRDSYLTMYAGQTAADVVELSELLSVPVSKLELEPATRSLANLGSALSARDYVLARRAWNDLGRAMGAFHLDYDLLLTPTLADLPQPVGSLYPSRAEQRVMGLSGLPGVARVALATGQLASSAEAALAKTPFTQLANLTGQPAMSVPLFWSDEQLPVGVQLVAPIGDEATLLQLAGQLERTRPWAERRPPPVVEPGQRASV